MTFSTVSSFLVFLLPLCFHIANATSSTTFDVRNDCPYTIWAAAVPGGGRQLNPGQIWSLNVPSSSTSTSRIWPRTNCTFDESGRGKCQTGDCNGLLRCQVFGNPPNSIAEYALNLSDDIDFFDVSLVNGFNVPIEFSPNSDGCTQGSRCIGDINGDCPDVLRAPGGCNNPCTVFNTDEYCCSLASSNCGPTDYSRFFKTRCPDAYSYPKEDPPSTFTCPTGTNYRIVFCPSDQDRVQLADKSADMCSRTLVLRSITNFGSVSVC